MDYSLYLSFWGGYKCIDIKNLFMVLGIYKFYGILAGLSSLWGSYGQRNIKIPDILIIANKVKKTEKPFSLQGCAILQTAVFSSKLKR